jgi:hypothetical protein
MKLLCNTVMNVLQRSVTLSVFCSSVHTCILNEVGVEMIVVLKDPILEECVALDFSVRV